MNSLESGPISDNISSPEQNEPENNKEFEVREAQSLTASNPSCLRSVNRIPIGLTMGSPQVNEVVKETKIVG